MDSFALDVAFEASSFVLANLPLRAVRLQADARWPWLVLIPRRPDLREIDDLPPDDQGRLWAEISAAGEAVRALGAAAGAPVETLNLAKIGNVTAQLHIHVVGRRPGDPCWPAPPWGQAGARAYAPEALAAALATARGALRPRPG